MLQSWHAVRQIVPNTSCSDRKARSPIVDNRYGVQSATVNRRNVDDAIGVARGAVGAPAPPKAVKKIFSGVIYRENV